MGSCSAGGCRALRAGVARSLPRHLRPASRVQPAGSPTPGPSRAACRRCARPAGVARTSRPARCGGTVCATTGWWARAALRRRRAPLARWRGRSALGPGTADVGAALALSARRATAAVGQACRCRAPLHGADHCSGGYSARPAGVARSRPRRVSRTACWGCARPTGVVHSLLGLCTAAGVARSLPAVRTACGCRAHVSTCALRRDGVRDDGMVGVRATSGAGGGLGYGGEADRFGPVQRMSAQPSRRRRTALPAGFTAMSRAARWCRVRLAGVGRGPLVSRAAGRCRRADRVCRAEAPTCASCRGRGRRGGTVPVRVEERGLAMESRAGGGVPGRWWSRG